ncbi:MAG TPA: PAS domain-containing protein [Terriglobales bacterium]|jgi:PAS domain S-box-containing protein
MSSVEVAAALDLFEIAPCGYVFSLPDGTLKKTNGTFRQWTGYKAEDLHDRKRFQDLMTRPAAIFYETHFAPLLRMQGFVREITVEFVRADGSTFPALVNANVHHGSAGEPVLILSTIFDIRERRQYERELLLERRRAEQWAVVVAHASQAILTTDADQKVTSWNRGSELLFGYTAAEAIGRSFTQLLVQEADVDQFEQNASVLRSGAPMQQDMMLRHKDGRLMDVAVSLTPHIEPVDEYTGFSAIVVDLRERRKLEEAQQMARDLKLANELAHEINNPLQALVNCMTLVAATGEKDYILTAEESLERIAAVIARLANVTRK